VQSQVPPTAIGKDYPMEVTGSVDAFPNRLLGFARWLSRSHSRLGRVRDQLFLVPCLALTFDGRL
jgi:hypothetical protein